MRRRTFVISSILLVAAMCGAGLVAGPQNSLGSGALMGDDGAEVVVGARSYQDGRSFIGPSGGYQLPHAAPRTPTGQGPGAAGVGQATASGAQPSGAQPSGAQPSGTQPSGDPSGPLNIYAETMGPGLSPAVQGIPSRAYVPNTADRTVSVIDTATFEVIDKFSVGKVPHHITPSWDLTKLYVNNTEGDSLTVIDPRTFKPVETLPIVDPYNLYFTPDGSKAIVVAERYQRLDFFERTTWKLIKSVDIPWSGVDHGDFTADGRYFLASTEFSGKVVKVDTQAMALVGSAEVGGLPVDVKVAPNGEVAYVTNQGRSGVSIVDPEAMTEIGFIPTGEGAHGLAFSRDTRSLYVSNRLDGTMSVIDLATRTIRATWKVGGSPDMIQVTADGSQVWVSNRYHGSVSVIDSNTGNVLHTIVTGKGAHGLALFPQPGRYSVGHNGVYR